MLGHQPFYHGSVRKVIVAFGTLFNDIKIVRRDKEDDPRKTIVIPLTYAAKQKFIQRLLEDPDAGSSKQKGTQVNLPRMSYEITGLTYDTERKLTTTGKTYAITTSSNGFLKAQYNPVPYSLSLNLNIAINNIEDGLMILEQILPFFTPDYTVSIQDMPELSLEKDIPVILNGMSPEDSFDGRLEDRRIITWTLQFTVKAYLYPPIAEDRIITSPIISLNDSAGNPVDSDLTMDTSSGWGTNATVGADASMYSQSLTLNGLTFGMIHAGDLFRIGLYSYTVATSVLIKNNAATIAFNPSLKSDVLRGTPVVFLRDMLRVPARGPIRRHVHAIDCHYLTLKETTDKEIV